MGTLTPALSQRQRAVGRLPFVLGGVAIIALLIAVASVFVLYRDMNSSLVGTDLNRVPAPAFTLTDQNGQQVSLTQFKGQPTIETFLYTHCPDVCPLIADQVHVALSQLGPDASNVGLLAVSTDPSGDTRAAATDFVHVHSLDGQMHYLLGSPADLQPVWKDYFIGVTPDTTPSQVDHSEALFVLDKAGAERVLLGVPFRAEDLAGDLKKLLSE